MLSGTIVVVTYHVCNVEVVCMHVCSDQTIQPIIYKRSFRRRAPESTNQQPVIPIESNISEAHKHTSTHHFTVARLVEYDRSHAPHGVDHHLRLWSRSVQCRGIPKACIEKRRTIKAISHSNSRREFIFRRNRSSFRACTQCVIVCVWVIGTLPGSRLYTNTHTHTC